MATGRQLSKDSRAVGNLRSVNGDSLEYECWVLACEWEEAASWLLGTE